MPGFFQVLSWTPDVYLADGVLQAFYELFRELTDLDEHRQAVALGASEGSSPAPSPVDQHRQQDNSREQQDAPQQQQSQGRVVIDPTPLREAINALPGQEFKIGGLVGGQGGMGKHASLH